MIEPTALLESYLAMVRAAIGAVGASLFVPARQSWSGPLLIEEGGGPGAPELETATAAAELVDARPRPRALSPGIFEVESADPDCLILSLSHSESDAAGRRRDRADRRRRATPPAEPPVWLALRFAAGERPAGAAMALRQRASDEDTAEKGEVPGTRLLEFAGRLALHAAHVVSYLRDGLTRLPDRSEFQVLLDDEIAEARRGGRQLALLFVNADDFERFNDRHGGDAGDRAVAEIAGRLRSSVRGSDLVSRYGGVTFAVVLRIRDTDVAAVAARILTRLSDKAYLDGTVSLEFGIGVALFDPRDDGVRDGLDLVQRADQALRAAKRSTGSAIVDWADAADDEDAEGCDRLAGIFTGNVARDYRNMGLLWETLDAVSRNDDVGEIAARAVERLFRALKPARIGLFSVESGGELVPRRALARRRFESGEGGGLSETIEVGSQELDLIQRALREEAPAEDLISCEDPPEQRHGYALPLAVEEQALGALYLDWPESAGRLSSSDLEFLRGLAQHLAMVWDRNRLVGLELDRREREERRLRSELQQLRRAVRQSKLVYRSPQMEHLLEKARRVASTDATILITGPSGTGKELVARSVHRMSDRRRRPFVIVDCAAIPVTLIERELFGHERGAFTGADRRAAGRLAEADGGTLLLDEIGELPLEVQSKLLRFVQEKQFTPVGGGRTQSVDVRLLAATNRDLASEVAAGRFREDLFYRLNVVALDVPGLVERPDDIPLLARHFLELYCAQYQKDVQRLDDAAVRELSAHDWPGNVRELQNRVMQGVLLCRGESLTPRDLGLPAAARSLRAGTDSPRSAPSAEVGEGIAVAEAAPGRAPPGGVAARAELLERLRRQVGRQLRALRGRDPADLPPLAVWLADDLLLAAHEATGGVQERAAERLGIAPTTYRRRFAKAVEHREAAERRTFGWEAVTETARRLVAQAVSAPARSDLLTLCEGVLLREIVERHAGRTTVGCALLGVSAPTFRRRVAALRRRASG